MIQRNRLTIHPDRWGKHKYEPVGAPGDTMFWVIIKDTFLRPVFYPGLKELNLRAFLWHAMLTVFIVVMFVVKDPKFFIEFNKMWAKPTLFPQFLYSTECGGTTHTDVFEYFDCIRPQNEQWRNYTKVSDIQIYNPVIVKGAQWKVASLLLIFEILTSGFHFLVWWKNELYQKLLDNQIAVFRWAEYSVTASLMFWCSLSLSRVQDQFLLISLFINSFFLNWTGGAMFETAFYAERTVQDTDLKIVFKRIKWICFYASWSCFIINIWTAMDAFYTVLSPYYALPTGK